MSVVPLTLLCRCKPEESSLQACLEAGRAHVLTIEATSQRTDSKGGLWNVGVAGSSRDTLEEVSSDSIPRTACCPCAAGPSARACPSCRAGAGTSPTCARPAPPPPVRPRHERSAPMCARSIGSSGLESKAPTSSGGTSGCSHRGCTAYPLGSPPACNTGSPVYAHKTYPNTNIPRPPGKKQLFQRRQLHWSMLKERACADLRADTRRGWMGSS